MADTGTSVEHDLLARSRAAPQHWPGERLQPFPQSRFATMASPGIVSLCWGTLRDIVSVNTDLPETEARRFLAIEKILVDEIAWERSPEQGTQMIFSAGLCDKSGASIQGLTVELAFRVPAQFDDCKYTFTIFAFRGGGSRKRAYQLEVIPIEERGHNGVNRCYGPHEHIGTSVGEVRVGHLDCRNHDKWFRVFLDRANIGYGGRYIGPFDGDLFRDM